MIYDGVSIVSDDVSICLELLRNSRSRERCLRNCGGDALANFDSHSTGWVSTSLDYSHGGVGWPVEFFGNAVRDTPSNVLSLLLDDILLSSQG